MRAAVSGMRARGLHAAGDELARGLGAEQLLELGRPHADALEGVGVGLAV